MQKKQVILFLIDTQGANCVGCYRPDLRLHTPNIDQLAQQGQRFDAAHTCSPVCGPARSAIFTGLYPHSNGVIANDMSPHLDVPTIGQRLSAYGVPTGYVGKWHLDGTDYFGNGRCPPGWTPDYWMDGRNYLESLPDDNARLLSRQVLNPSDIARHRISSEFTHAHRIADLAMRFIDEHRDQDFLLVVSIDEPHHPAIAPEPYASAFEDFEFPVFNADDPLVDKPRSQREWAAHTAKAWASSVHQRDGRTCLRHPRHFACNSYSDSQVGRVIHAIDRHTPDALVVYTSDHGDMFGSHGLHGKGPCMYEEITRIPFIVRWPGQAPAGSISVGPVSHIDLVPTFLQYFGIAIPELVQGRSLLPQLRRPEHRVNPEIFMEFNRFEVDHDGFGAFAPIRSIFDGRYKLCVNLIDSDELYDLKTDPLELRNLIRDAETAEVRDRLHTRLLVWMNETRDPLRGPHWGRRDWRSPDESSTWGGSTRPRPADESFYSRSLLYETAKPAMKREYPKY